MSFIKSCGDCTFYNRGYCQRKARNVLSIGEAVTCNYYTPIGQVAISDLSLLGGQLAEWQIPSAIITTAKIADSAIQTAKINNSAVTEEKVADQAITAAKIKDGTILTADLEDFIVTNQKVSATAAIDESKLNLDQSTADLLLAATYLAHDHSLADPTQIDHANLLNVLANQHHNQQHDLDSSDHVNTLSWSKVNKTSSALADLASRLHSSLQSIGVSDHHAKTTSISDLTDHTKANHDLLTLSHDSLADVSIDDHHSEVHVLDGAKHTVSGLTAGHFLKALTASTFGFAAHGLTYSDVGAAASSHSHTRTKHVFIPTKDISHDGSWGTLGAVAQTSVGSGIIARIMTLSSGQCGYLLTNAYLQDVDSSSVTVRVWYAYDSTSDPSTCYYYISFHNDTEGGSWNVANGASTGITWGGNETIQKQTFSLSDSDFSGDGWFSFMWRYTTLDANNHWLIGVTIEYSTNDGG